MNNAEKILKEMVCQALQQARIPDIPEIHEQFERASRRFLEAVNVPLCE